MTMTLEQIRDVFTYCIGHGMLTIYGGTSVREIRDSLDFHLSQPQPVAQGEAESHLGKWRRVINESMGPTPEGDATPTSPTGHRVVPAQPVEAVGDVLPVPFAIDRTHENQAFVTMGFDSVDHCTQFIKKLSSSRYRVAALDHPRPVGVPDGWKIVPVDDVTLHEAAEEALDLLEHVDPEHGITTQLRNALAASPSAGGV